MSKKMTQREWDRIVGIGRVEEALWKAMEDSTELVAKGRWTNHEETLKRHPDNKDDKD